MHKLLVGVALAGSGIAEAEPASFVEIGTTAGGTHEGDMYAGLTAGGGYELKSWLWLHGEGVVATAPVVHFAGIDQYEGTSDRFGELRGGLELRACSENGVVCGIAGVDVGYRHERYDDSMQVIDRSSGEAVARLGADLGTRNVRVRPVLEGTTTHTGDTTGFVLGGAYVW